MRNFKWLLVLMAALLLLPGSTLAADDNLIKNGGFEKLDGEGMPSDWYQDAWVTREGVTLYAVTEESRTGEHAAVVENFGSNDARFAQRVKVKPNTMYRLSGYIRADGLEDVGRGANLSIEGLTYAYSASVYNSEGEWTYVELYGETGDDQKDLTVYVRVGGYSGESVGRALFDDIELVRVDELPKGVYASPWYTIKQPEIIDPVEEAESGTASPAWPLLLVLAALYTAFACWLMRHLQLDRHEWALLEQKSRRHSMPLFAIVGMVIAALVRVIVALNVEGYQVDVNCFTAWGNTMSNWGAALFYQQNWCDYTPGYVYVMGVNGSLANLLSGIVTPAFVHKLVPMMCDLLGAGLICRLAMENGVSRKQAGTMALLLAFNPAIILNSAAWCQIDSVLCLGLMLVAYFAIHRKWMAVLPMYVLCALVKPQALMLGFLGLAAIVMEIVRTPKIWKQMLIGVGISLAIALVIVLPFSPNQESAAWLFNLYGDTLSSYPYATVNTANLYYLFGANWDGIANPAHTGVAVFFTLICAFWAVWTFLKRNDQRAIGREQIALLEPVIMAAFAVAFLVMAFIGVNWTVLGATAMALAFFVVLPMYLRGGKLAHLPLCGAVLFILLYVLGIKMHERYLFPAIFLLGMAYAIRHDRRILALLITMSAVLFVNEGIILDNSIRLGSEQGHLNWDTRSLAMLLSAVNVAASLFSVWVCHRVCVMDAAVKLDEQFRDPLLPVRKHETQPCQPASFRMDASCKIRRVDVLLMAVVTLIYAIVTFTTLGSTKAPQNPWKSTSAQETLIVDLGKRYENFTILYNAQVSYGNFYVNVSDTGEDGSWGAETWAEMNQGQCFRWKYVTSSYMANKTDSYGSSYQERTFQGTPIRFNGRYVRISPEQIGLILNEVIFRDAEGNTIPVASVTALNAHTNSRLYTDPNSLVDEQNTLAPGEEPSWWNSTYFDEIYHARTGFEHMNGTSPYETSHPPLGKVIMSWCIAIFGMTPFGWRFAGALCGALMLPAMYLLVKQLTKRTDLSFIGMMLMTLDCMHFTQTRIATIDSFPVLFIILSWWFMLRFMQRDLVLDGWKKLLPDLALSGFFMGCGFASKWIGAYSGLGLAVLYFWTCLRHLRLGYKAKRQLDNLSDSMNLRADELDVLKKRANGFFKRILFLCLWCLLFFVTIPLIIYILSYIPYYAHRSFSGVGDYISTLWNTQVGMMDYHSTPGLGMDHPFYSPWYEWPLMMRPMYYASPSFTPTGYSYAIFCFGNPWVWVVGLVGIAYCALRWIDGHRYRVADVDGQYRDDSVKLFQDSWDIAPAFVLIGLLAQFLPWVLVPRGTYIYHYFASVPFLILGTVLLIGRMTERNPKRGRIIWIVYLALCLIWFILLFPYASGVLTPEWWMDFIQDYPWINKIPDYWKNDFLSNLNSFLEKIPIFPHVYH